MAINPAIAAAYDAALASAKVETEELIWTSDSTFTVPVTGNHGRRYITGRISEPTPDCLRQALIKVLGDYCIAAAVVANAPTMTMADLLR